LIVKVLSESTEGRDRLENWIAYRNLPSLREHVLIAQDPKGIEIYRRTPDSWDQINLGPGDDVELASVGLRFPFNELYADLPEAHDQSID
jgi:Uma2 family endonuclease